MFRHYQKYIPHLGIMNHVAFNKPDVSDSIFAGGYNYTFSGYIDEKDIPATAKVERSEGNAKSFSWQTEEA